MDTQIAFERDGKPYNKFHEEIIKCEGCSNPTTMLGTKLCDQCWNAKGIFNEREIMTIQMSLDLQKKAVIDLRVSRHWSNEDKKKRIIEIDSIKQKIKAISND